MLALGGLLISIALLLLAAGAITFRQPDAPRWTTRTWIHVVGTSAIVCLLAIGVGYLVTGAISAYEEGPSVVDLGLLIGVLTGASVIWRRLDVRARLKAFDAAAAAMHAPGNAGGSAAFPMRARQVVPTARSEPPPPAPRQRTA